MAEAQASAWRQRGIIYERMGEADSARYYFQQMLIKGQETSTLPLMAEACETLYRLEKQQGNAQAALAYHEQYLVYHDSIYSQQLSEIKGAESVRLNLEGEQRARQEAELQAQLLASRNLLYGAAALGLLAIVLVGGLLYRQLSTARKQLQLQNQQLRELNATKDKFFGIIAHDIRNPISALEGVGEQMAYYLGRHDEPRLRRLADRVDSTARQLSGLLDNLLSWALMQMGAIPYAPAAARLDLIAGEAVELYAPIAEAKGVALLHEIPAGMTAWADPRALHTILRNLIGNALKFTGAGGQVRLSAAETADAIQFEVNDTGVGISAEKLPRLFSAEGISAQGTAGEQGSGLGLMLCKELAERNQGAIRAISELGRGSRFIVSLPKLALS
jgi:signal transduction histidine kinase